MKALLFIIIVLLYSPTSIAQTNYKDDKLNLWGYVVDSFLQTGLEGAKVILMTPDSTMVDSIHTYPYDGNALFHFSLPAKTQNIILKAEQEGYEPGYVSMKVKHWGRVKDVYAPWINLKRRSSILNQLLNEVVVASSKIQMVWHGDTLVYNADSFNVPQGSMLDGLIRQLPGVTLKENGEILVNGRRVDYLTLNGTDFFKGNNKMMLDNLPYYIVKKIKVYDKSTDVSRFLGYDVEKKDYVMDVVLKREYSVGGTANVEVGGGTKDRWMARLYGMRFTDHSRLTLFGNSNNINETGCPGESGEWKTTDPANGVTTHSEVGASLRIEDRYKRWKDELSVSLTNNKNNRHEQQVNESYLQNGCEFVNRGYSEQAHDRKIDVTNTFTHDKSTSNVYFSSMVGYQYGYDHIEQQDCTLMSNKIGNLYRLDDQANRNSHNHNVFTANHMLVKLPWGDRLNLRLNALYGIHQAKNYSHYLLDYKDFALSRELRRRYEPHSFNQHNWQAETEYVFHVPRNWSLDISYKFQQSCDIEDAPSYRLDRDVVWMLQNPSLNALPPILHEDLLDVENSLDIMTQTKRHQVSASIHYTRSTSETYANFEVKLPIVHELGYQHYLRGTVDARIRRNETYSNPNISFTQQLSKHNIYYNVSFTSETRLPEITNLVGYVSHYAPLNIIIGNPGLKPQHTYKVAAYFVKSWPRWEQMLYTYFDATVTQRQIMTSVAYNPMTGVYTRRDENMNGNWGLLAGITFNRAIDKTKRWRVENALWLTYTNMVWRGQDTPYAENLMERITTRHIKIDDKMKLSFRLNGKFDMSVTGDIIHGLSWSDLASYKNVCVTDFSYGLAASWTMSHGFQLTSDFSMLHRNGYENRIMNSTSSIWNAQLSKTLCKDHLTLSLTAYDILDSTNKRTWNITSTGYNNTSYNTLPRYILLRVAYKLHKEKK